MKPKQATSTETIEQTAGEDRLFTTNFVLACLGNLAFFSGFHMLTPAIPLYVLAIGGSETDAGLVVGSFSIASLLGRGVAGWLTDTWQRKGPMLIGAAVFTIAAGLYAIAASVVSLMLVRIWHGLGLAGYSTASSVYATDIAPIRRRGEAIGYFGASGNLGLALGPAVGMFILGNNEFWRLFAVVGGLALLAFGVTALLKDGASKTRGVRARPSFRGSLILPEAVLPALVALCLATSWGSIVAFLPIFAIRQGLVSPGLFFSVVAVALIVVRALSGIASDRYGRLAVIVPGLVIVAAAIGVLGFANSLVIWLLVATLYGAGFGAVQPTLLAYVADRASFERRGAAMGTYWIGLELGITVGAVALGYVAEFFGFGVMFALNGLIVLAGLIALVISSRQPQQLVQR